MEDSSSGMNGVGLSWTKRSINVREEAAVKLTLRKISSMPPEIRESAINEFWRPIPYHKVIKSNFCPEVGRIACRGGVL